MATSDRGLASMDQKTKHKVQSQGGKQSQANDHAHQLSGPESHDAGKKGGHKAGQDNHQDHQRMAEGGRKGGKH